MAQNTPGQQLSDLLVTRGYDPEMLDSSGKAAASAQDAEIFSFDFVTSNGTNHGTVVVMLGDDKELDVFSGDNVGRGMDSEDKTEWYEFQHQLKNFATKNFMTFGSQNINKLKFSMQGQAALKEGLCESWNGTKNVSWNGGPDSVRLMIRHKRPMGIDEARFRQVDSLFVETADGERYRLPFRNLAGGRAMVEHVRQGGKPYDMRGQHIATVIEELNVLSRFRRASKGQVFEGDTANLVVETNNYYETMCRTLKGLSTSKGYNSYFESWNPGDITEQDLIIEDIKTLFVQETIDSRIEQALPILARIQQQGTAMKEANIFEAWAERLVEGTWATPNTPEQKEQLIELLSKELPVGADATNATEQLYSLLGDDVLFDQLQELAEMDANADARQLIIDRMTELADGGLDTDIMEVLAALDTASVEQPASDEEDYSALPDEASDSPMTEGHGPSEAEQLDHYHDLVAGGMDPDEAESEAYGTTDWYTDSDDEQDPIDRMMEMAGHPMTNRRQLDEGVMDIVKSLVPKAMKLLGGDTVADIANKVKQVTGGDYTPNEENATKVAQAFGFDKMIGSQQGQVAEGLAGNWQGKLLQLLHLVGIGAGAAAASRMVPMVGDALVARPLMAIGLMLLMVSATFWGSDKGMVGAMGRHGNTGTETGKGPSESFDEQDAIARMMEMAGTPVAEDDPLNKYRQRVQSQGFTDSPEERNADRLERKRRHNANLDKISNIGGLGSDEEAKHQAQQRMARDEYELQRRKDSDEDWGKTYDMMRDRLNRMQYKNQQDVDPEQLKKITDIKYNPIREGMSNADYTPEVGEDILWRSRDPMNKMMPITGTVVSITPGQTATVKITSPRMIQNLGKDTIALDLAKYVLMPAQGTAEGSPDFNASLFRPSHGQDRAAWVAKTEKQFPTAQIALTRTPNGPAKATVDGKVVAEFPEASGVAEGTELNTMLKYAGMPVAESRVLDEAGETIDHILNRFKHEVKQFEAGHDMDSDLYEALFDYYSDSGDMPYGIAKARTGDPFTWVSDQLAQHLGVNEGVAGSLLGGIAGAALTKTPGGAMAGSRLGSAAQDAVFGGQEETDEGQHTQHGMDATPGARDYNDEKLADIRPMSFKQDPIQATTDRALKYGAVGVNKLRDLFREDEEAVVEDQDKFSALSGQYGHSGKLQKFDDVEQDVLARLKQLSGMIRPM